MDRDASGISFTMKNNRRIKRCILRGFGLPEDLDPHRFYVQWLGGDECLIEQHRGILCFEEDSVRFATEQGTLSVKGELLTVERMTEARALVRGGIRGISIEGKS